MAIQGGLPVAHGVVFPNGAFVVGEVTALEDFDAAQAAKEAGREVDTQIRDKQSGMRVWQVRVVDADELARKGQVEVTVKIAAEVQPVPPIWPATCRSGRWSSTTWSQRPTSIRTGCGRGSRGR